jgi:hypothetical protein
MRLVRETYCLPPATRVWTPTSLRNECGAGTGTDDRPATAPHVRGFHSAIHFPSLARSCSLQALGASRRALSTERAASAFAHIVVADECRQRWRAMTDAELPVNRVRCFAPRAHVPAAVNSVLMVRRADWDGSVETDLLRRNSTVLRRLVVQGELGRAWRAAGFTKEPQVQTMSLRLALATAPLDQIVFATAGGALRGTMRIGPMFERRLRAEAQPEFGRSA